jgi:hypothetical protein
MIVSGSVIVVTFTEATESTTDPRIVGSIVFGRVSSIGYCGHGGRPRRFSFESNGVKIGPTTGAD